MKRVFIVLGLILGVGIAMQAVPLAWFYVTESEDDELSIRWHRVWTLNGLEQETQRLVEEADSIEALVAALEASNFDVHYTESIAPTDDVDETPTRHLPDRRVVQGVMLDQKVRALNPGPPFWFKLYSYTFYSPSTAVAYRGTTVHRVLSSVSGF